MAPEPPVRCRAKPQVGTERFLYLSVGPQGRVARLDNALANAGAFGLLHPAAARIIDRIVHVVREWRGHFEASGIPALQCDRIASAFPRPGDIGMREVEKYLKN
jgi:serine/threonine-protein kinase HipA